MTIPFTGSTAVPLTRSEHDDEEAPIPEYDWDQCVAAMEGEKVPDNLDSFWHRRATVRGIRTSLKFAMSPAITELCSGDSDENRAHLFARARNARLIMSDIIPDIENPSTQPYCIWYPDLASAQTYRDLVRRYPSMRYQVGRACAAAEYVDLYKELDLLPEVSIAEEAREVDKEAEIYQIIMSAPQRYAVMDDFTRSVNLDNPQTPAFLNGNMKPRWVLGQRSRPPRNLPDTTADDIDIEEDGFIGQKNLGIDDCDAILGPGDSEQLWMPLPPDLPVLEKRLLTQMAAYEGNVDRYARLMHPRRLRTDIEFNCILRGIYHNTMFARWWAHHLETNPARAICPGKPLSNGGGEEYADIRTAINARRIMNNDITGLNDDSEYLPWMIWWPLKPQEATLRELAENCPSMKTQIAITCIMCDYQHVFGLLSPSPCKTLWIVAKRSDNPFYLNYIEERSTENGIKQDYTPDYDAKLPSLELDVEPGSTNALSCVDCLSMDNDRGYPPGIYGGLPVRAEKVERYAWLSAETAQKIEDDCDGVYVGADTRYLYLDS